jgi:hypothetical protein
MYYLSYFYIYLFFIKLIQIGVSIYILIPIYTDEQFGLYISYGSWLFVIFFQIILIILYKYNRIDDIRIIMWMINLLLGVTLFVLTLTLLISTHKIANPLFITISLILFIMVSIENVVFFVFQCIIDNNQKIIGMFIVVFIYYQY